MLGCSAYSDTMSVIKKSLHTTQKTTKKLNKHLASTDVSGHNGPLVQGDGNVTVDCLLWSDSPHFLSGDTLRRRAVLFNCSYSLNESAADLKSIARGAVYLYSVTAEQKQVRV